ncbi:MAG: hypothetical protein K1X88_30375 [Nannocystaceae bacterium]|nr:hypothetical protein [Nannocystaceae bacterium]
MRRGCDRFVLAVVPLLLAGCGACGPRPSGSDGGGADGGAAGRGDGRTLPVGNPSRGIDDQPDYDGMAQQLRLRMQPRLPQPLPDAATACAQMLAAAADFYAQTEADASEQHSRLRATHEVDRAACEAETSPAAAVCVALSLADTAGELPWLLDQCSRAFPKL